MTILVKMELWDVTEAQPAGHLVTQVMPGVLEGCHGFLLLALGAACGHSYRGMPPVGADLSVHHFDSQQPGILSLETDDLGKFFAERFRHS